MEQIRAEDTYVVLAVADTAGNTKALYTLNGTRHGTILPIFRIGGELDRFQSYAQQTLKEEFRIESILIVANNLNQIRVTLEERELLPSGQSRVALEGTDFFDEVIAELLSDTLWDESDS